MIKHSVVVLIVSILMATAIVLFGTFKENKNPISYKVFKITNGWGYDILVNDTVFIHQDHIPTIAGKKPFPSKKTAEKMAGLIINKIENFQPPTISTFELEQLLNENGE